MVVLYRFTLSRVHVKSAVIRDISICIHEFVNYIQFYT